MLRFSYILHLIRVRFIAIFARLARRSVLSWNRLFRAHVQHVDHFFLESSIPSLSKLSSAHIRGNGCEKEKQEVSRKEKYLYRSKFVIGTIRNARSEFEEPLWQAAPSSCS